MYLLYVTFWNNIIIIITIIINAAELDIEAELEGKYVFFKTQESPHLLAQLVKHHCMIYSHVDWRLCCCTYCFGMSHMLESGHYGTVR